MAGPTAIYGTPGDDVLVGGIDPYEEFFAYAGDDVIRGKGDTDYIHPGDGHDRCFGGAGNDVFDVTLAGGDLGDRDLFNGGDGTDLLQINLTAPLDPAHVSWIFNTRLGISGRAGAANQDSLVSVENFTITTDLDVTAIGGSEDNTFHTDAGNDRLIGGGGNDNLIGGAGRDVLRGGAGSDMLTAGAGRDRLFGGGGDDFLQVETRAAHLLNGGKGTDTVTGHVNSGDIGGGTIEANLATGRFGILGAADPKAATMRGIEGVQIIGTANAALTGNGHGNQLIGGFGSDLLKGRGGDDTLFASSGNDLLVGGRGDDHLGGDSGNDILDGGKGGDILDGGEGDDMVTGGKGQDTLIGGGGADTFMFDRVSDSDRHYGKADEIADFLTGVDKIDVSGIDADTATAGDEAFATAGGPAAHSLWLEAGTGGYFLVGDVDGDATRDFAIFLNGTALFASDLIL